MSVPRLAVLGAHGYGASHVLAALALQDAGRAELVGLVDPRRAPVVRDATTLGLADLPRFYPSLPDLLAQTSVDVVVVSTPLHTHATLARQALEAGADVLLEKPPVTSRRELSDLLACQRATAGLVQVGFQSLGSLALTALAGAVRDGRLGAIARIGALGSWSRDRAYYARAPWAGRRRMPAQGQRVQGRPAGIDVVDGTVTNPFAHAVMDLLFLAGRTRAQDVGRIEVDLYHAHDIEADDTASVRIGAADRSVAGGVDGSERSDLTYTGPLMAAFTLAGPQEAPPVIEVVGSIATARLFYTEDRLEVDGVDDGQLAGVHGRIDLLDDLLAVREEGGRLISPLSATESFVEVVEAVRAVLPAPVDPRFVQWHGEGERARPVIDAIDEALVASVGSQRLLREIGLPWTR